MTVLKPKRKVYVRRLAAAETWAAQAVITKRLDTLAAERAWPWWRRPGRSVARPQMADGRGYE